MTAAPGGAPYNVARGCARLGAPTALVATVSDDGFGRRLAAGLAESGVDDALLQRTTRPTTLAVAQLDAGGTASYEFYTEGTSAPLLTPERLPDAVDVLVTGGLGLVLEPIATAIESIVMATGPDVLVLVDLNCRPAAVDDDAAYGLGWTGCWPAPTSSRPATRTSPTCDRASRSARPPSGLLDRRRARRPGDDRRDGDDDRRRGCRGHRPRRRRARRGHDRGR